MHWVHRVRVAVIRVTTTKATTTRITTTKIKMIIRSKVDRIEKVEEVVVDPWLRMHSIVYPNLEIVMNVVGEVIVDEKIAEEVVAEAVDVIVVAAVEGVEEETETEICPETDVVGMNLKKKLISIL